MADFSLLSTTSRIEAPFIKVTIGDYTFGVYQKTQAAQKDASGLFYTTAHILYPNYVQSLKIIKINGQVNQYTLTIKYPVGPNDDPNFFEKVFSSVSTTRKIVFSYGDSSMPSYIYKDEQALITKINTNFGLNDRFNSVITYTISAVSSAILGISGNFTFINTGEKKPSDEIKRVLYDQRFGLLELFYGMTDRSKVELANLIPGDDQAVPLESKTNVSALDYINYLVDCMIPVGSTNKSITNTATYLLTIHDDVSYDTDTQIKDFGGPYFKITKSSSEVEHSDAYVLDIGYPNNNIVSNFQTEENENYSMYYEWNDSLSSDVYVRRLNDKGQWETEYAPTLSSKNDQHKTLAQDKAWWTKVTEYPIKASVTIKGLLRPALLMTYVRINMWFPGSGSNYRKHISSGLYIVTQQQDQIDGNGYKTTLSLTRIAGDKDLQ